MTKASWYKFWKESDLNGVPTEDYIWYDPNDVDTWIDIDIEHEVEHHSGGFYNFEKINIPPFQWLKKELECGMDEKRTLDKEIERISETLLRWDEKSEDD